MWFEGFEGVSDFEASLKRRFDFRFPILQFEGNFDVARMDPDQYGSRNLFDSHVSLYRRN